MTDEGRTGPVVATHAPSRLRVQLIAGASLVLASIFVTDFVAAQTAADPNPTVTWSAVATAVPRGAKRATLNVRASIKEGWHVYALKQAPTGPTPLVVAVESNETARSDGPPKSSAPTVAFEPAFGFATPYHTRSVSVDIPVRFRSGLAAGRQIVPVSVRYQSCDGRTCEPPKTIHLKAPLEVRGES